jgi:hypothetical protein
MAQCIPEKTPIEGTSLCIFCIFMWTGLEFVSIRVYGGERTWLFGLVWGWWKNVR